MHLRMLEMRRRPGPCSSRERNAALALFQKEQSREQLKRCDVHDPDWRTRGEFQEVFALLLVGTCQIVIVCTRNGSGTGTSRLCSSEDTVRLFRLVL